MSEEVIERLVGEPEENKRQRARLKQQLEVLREESEFCKRFVGLRLHDEV